MRITKLTEKDQCPKEIQSVLALTKDHVSVYVPLKIVIKIFISPPHAENVSSKYILIQRFQKANNVVHKKMEQLHTSNLFDAKTIRIVVVSSLTPRH